MPPKLTPLEYRVATLIGEGKTVVEVARLLDRPLATVRVHVRTIAKKLPNPSGLPAVRLIRAWQIR